MAPARSKSKKSTQTRPTATAGDRPISPSRQTSAPHPHSSFEALPPEVFNHILSYLVHPRSRLPGLTEGQSHFEFPKGEQWEVKKEEDLTAPPDSNRHFNDIFSWAQVRHPFNVLARTSRRCKVLVESYSSHLVKTCNIYHLPFELLEKYGTVYPDMSYIVYRRLWLQTAPRRCVFCAANVSTFPHRPRSPMLMCEDCFYAQALTLQEIQKQYHIQDTNILAANHVRGTPNYEWVLRIDVEALALRMFKTRAFHSIHPDHDRKPCQKCRRARVADEASKVIPKPSGQLPSHVRQNTRSQRRP